MLFRQFFITRLRCERVPVSELQRSRLYYLKQCFNVIECENRQPRIRTFKVESKTFRGKRIA